MLYTAKVNKDPRGYVAECVEIDAAGRGDTRSAALDALREELEDLVGHVEGVAPPPTPADISIEIVVVDEKSSPSGR